MADELDRILRDLGDDMKSLSRVMESTFRIFRKDGKKDKELAEQTYRIRKQTLDQLVKEKVLSKSEAVTTLKAIDAEKKETLATTKATGSVKKFGNSLTEAGKKATTSLKDLPMAIVKGVIDTGKMFIGAGNKVDGFQKALSGFDGVSVLGMKLSDLGSVVDFNSGIFKQMSQSGAGFGKSVINLRNAAGAANMPILDFVDLIGKNTDTLGRLFGNVESGVASMGAFAKTLRTRTQQELAGFGLNLEDTSEFLGTMLEMERVRGNSDRIKQMDLVGATVDYTKNLVQLSKLTGMSVKELDNQNAAMSANGAFQAQLANMNPKQAADMQTMAGVMGRLNPGLGQLFEEVTALGQPISDTSRGLAVMAPGLIDSIKEFKNGTLSAEQFFNQMGSSASLKNLEAFGDASYAGGQFGEALNAIAALQRGQSAGLQSLMDAEGDNTKTMIAAKDTLEVFKSNTEKAGTAVLNLAINSIPDAMAAIGNAVASFDKNYKGKFPGLMGALTNGGKALMVKIYDAGEEFIFKGEDGKNFIDNITPWDTLNERLLKMDQFKKEQANKSETGPHTFPKFYNGTDGFQDFGSGTPAMLHGSEAVVPRDSMFGSALDALMTLKGTAGTPGGTVNNTTNNNSTTDMTKLNANTEQLIALTEKTANHLNMLVTIGAMTEKNTKSTNNSLANMGGSLV